MCVVGTDLVSVMISDCRSTKRWVETGVNISNPNRWSVVEERSNTCAPQSSSDGCRDETSEMGSNHSQAGHVDCL